MDINQNCAITEQEVQTQHRVNHVILPVEKTGGGGGGGCNHQKTPQIRHSKLIQHV